MKLKLNSSKNEKRDFSSLEKCTELSEFELRFCVNGGGIGSGILNNSPSFTPTKSGNIDAREQADGNGIGSGIINAYPSFSSSYSSSSSSTKRESSITVEKKDVPTGIPSKREEPKMNTVVAVCSIDEREEKDKETEIKNIEKKEKKDTEILSNNIDKREEKDQEIVINNIDKKEEKEAEILSNNIDEREKKEGVTEPAANPHPKGYDYSNGNNPHDTKEIKVTELSDGQTLDVDVDYTKNVNVNDPDFLNNRNGLGITIRTRNSDGTYDYSFGKVISQVFMDVCNNVRTKEERGGIPVNYNGYDYFPEQFPDCEVDEETGQLKPWIINGVGTSEDPFIGPLKITTDAFTYVTTYDSDGNIITDSQYDDGYYMHYGEGTTTYGCLKLLSYESLYYLYKGCDDVLSTGTKPKLYIRDANVIGL